MNQNFTPSSRADNIHYGDIFRINDKNCLVFGYGKTEACRIASDHEKEAEIATDFACLTKDNDHNLYGHFEPFIRPKGTDDPIKHRKQIDCLMRMFNQEETNFLLKSNPHLKDDELPLIDVYYKFFVQLSDFNITFSAEPITSIMPVEGIPVGESDPQTRRENFLNLTQKANLPCKIVLWGNTVEDKADIIKRDLK